MRFGFVLPQLGPRVAVDLAREAEDAGWDAVFVDETPYGVDAWVTLGAAAALTDRIRLGTMITPLPRMRPWKVASEAATLDHLSGGRVILGVGLGAPDTGYAELGEETDLRTRAELLDEGLDIVAALWSGEPFEIVGKHYTVRRPAFHPPPPPVQQPRIPIWVVAAWPRERSMRRALRYDGLLPNVLDADGRQRPYTPDDIRAITDRARAEGPRDRSFDIVADGTTPADDAAAAAAEVARWEAAGATWWVETTWELAPGTDAVAHIHRRIAAGPPSA